MCSCGIEEVVFWRRILRMEMEDEMDMEVVFEAREIDLDYEFEAAMFFDFSREESFLEAREAELWFESAKSYPPSPFAAKLFLREDLLLENAGTSSKCQNEENRTVLLKDDMAPEFSSEDVNNRVCEEMNGGVFTNLWRAHIQKTQNQPQKPNIGFVSYNNMVKDKIRSKTKSNLKPISRSSTLMKPTASQLAKQTPAPQVGSSRFQMLSVLRSEKSSCNSSVVETQAVKRQKLEGGHLRKVGEVNQQANFIHKPPKKEGTVDGNSMHTKLKLTIPREPDLETSHRAQRIRPKNSTEHIHEATATRKFRARPLNRKILEAPSLPLPKKTAPKLPEFQEFHLKTLERAMQHTSAVSSSSLLCDDFDKVVHKPSTNSVIANGNKLLRRPGTSDTPKQDQCEAIHSFKARPLNKKIFSSKGDLGVFRNTKRENTVPMEFKFQTEKRIQHTLPIELFSKLSLAPELQPQNGSELKLHRPSCTSIKGSKENRLDPFQQEHETTHIVKEKLSIFDGKQIKRGSVESITATKSLGIR